MGFKVQFIRNGCQVGQRLIVETDDAREAEQTAKSLLKSRGADRYVVTPHLK